MKKLSMILEAQEGKLEFIMLKPGFINLSPIIIQRLNAVGLVPVKWIIKKLTLDEAKRFYKPHEQEDFYDELCKYMSSDSSMGISCVNTLGIDVSQFKDSIRKEFGKSDMKNVMHSSDNLSRRTIESNIYFK